MLKKIKYKNSFSTYSFDLFVCIFLNVVIQGGFEVYVINLRVSSMTCVDCDTERIRIFKGSFH